MTILERYDFSHVPRASHLGRRAVLGGIVGAAAASWLVVGATPLSAAVDPAAADTRDAVTVVKDDLVAGGHILSNENIIDAFGHISARHRQSSGCTASLSKMNQLPFISVSPTPPFLPSCSVAPA